MAKRTAVLYARISVTTEESVSVARQLASGRRYAAARGWRVVGEYIDDGVSATRNKPEDRAGWRALMNSQLPFEAVIVWKVDRLARRVIDFLHADETLQARGAAIACVEQSIDMTTGEGRAFAQMLAVFGEMEASAISSRLVAAREHMLSEGRVPGGLQPYGWLTVPNPRGPGRVRAQDPDRIDWVREMASRALSGATVYSVMTWLNEAGAPRGRSRPGAGAWGYSSVDILLRNPVLAGMYPIGVSGRTRACSTPDVRRDASGNPIVGADGVITLKDYWHLQQAMTHKAHPSARSPKAGRSSPLVALLSTCSECGTHMHRTPSRGHPGLFCMRCGQFVTMDPLVQHVVRRLLSERGSQRMYRRALIVPDGPAATHRLAHLDHALRTAAIALTENRTEAQVRALQEEIARLKRERTRMRRRFSATAVERLVYVGLLRDVWDLCADDEQRHDVLAGQVSELKIRRAPFPGSVFQPSRVELTWKTRPRALVPDAISVGPVHRGLARPPEWISYRQACCLVGSSDTLVRRGIKSGQIVQRKVDRMLPSLRRDTVVAFVRDQAATC